MKWQVTSHAVDRFVERVEPALSYSAATTCLRELVVTAKHVGTTPRGEQIYRLSHPANPLAVVKFSRRRKCKTAIGAAVLTVLTAEMWHDNPGDLTRPLRDELLDVLESFEELQGQVPENWKPERPAPLSAHDSETRFMAFAEHLKPLERDNLWARLMALLEAERRRVAHYVAETSGAEDMGVTLAAIGACLRRGDIVSVREVFDAWEIRHRRRMAEPDARPEVQE